MVLEGKRERVYLSPSAVEGDFLKTESPWKPDNEIEHVSGCTNAVVYGFKKFGELFTKRQLITLSTFSDLIEEMRAKAVEDAVAGGFANDGKTLVQGGSGAIAYADALAVLLTFSLSKLADLGNAFCGWEPIAECPRHLFGKQAIPMVWDFAESNPFSSSSGSWFTCVEGLSKAYSKTFFATSPKSLGVAVQDDAATQSVSAGKLISTDPPYYDNIPYAVLSDFFYVWMRKSLRKILPDIFSTLAVPKAEELVAAPYRTGTKDKAEDFFMSGMTNAIHNLALHAHPSFPVTIYYAFKQSETKEGSTTSAGWVAFLEAVIRAGFTIDGTWPLSTENASRMRGQGSNALASSVVLVCRRRDDKIESLSRRDFQRLLREDMPDALEAMIGGETGQTPIAPVDLAQSAIGPGMAIYSKYAAVLNQDGSRMSVHDALILINRAISDYLNPDSGSFDADTLFCDDWFAQYGWSAGAFGDANTLAQAKGTSVDGVHSAGVIESGGGKVRLLKWSEYPSDWDPRNDTRTPVWEACHQMIRALNQQGEAAAGALLARMPEQGEPIRQLAYHLYTLCERKKWAEEARAYNELIGSWHAIVAASHDTGHRDEQIGLEL